MVARVFDTETTGFRPPEAQVIQIGSIDLTSEGGYENEYESLVDISPLKCEPKSSGVHHIIDEDLAGAPVFDEAVKPLLGADVYIAHNAKFDLQWMPIQILRSPIICTMCCAQVYWGKRAPDHKNLEKPCDWIPCPLYHESSITVPAINSARLVC